jgi:transmembrane sensor
MSTERIEAEAAEWLARLDGEPGPEVHVAFERWCAASAAHRRAYAELAGTWARLDLLRDVHAETVEEAPAPIPERAATTGTDTARPFHIRRYAIAAVLTIAVAGATAFWMSIRPDAYATDTGEQRRVVLADGSVVEMNTNTRLRVRETAGRRDVFLEQGEASFSVAHDATRPFSVYVDQTCVRATGTKFIVRRAQDVEVLVTEGAVALLGVAAGGAAPLLPPPDAPRVRAGQGARVGRGQVALESLSQADVDQRTAWERGMLMFRNDTLGAIAAEFNRYNERKLVLADARTAELRLGGYFKAANVDEFIDAIEDTYGVRARRQGATIILEAAPEK